MRLFLQDALTDEDIAHLLPSNIEKLSYPCSYTTGGCTDFESDPVIRRISQEIKKYVPVKLEAPSRWYVECNPKGHGPHYDGARLGVDGKFGPNHMAWCQYSAVSLLTDPSSFSGGEFSFHDPPDSYKEELQKTVVIYSSGITNKPQKHSAAPHSDGVRMVLLMFFAS
mgnify:CR=1 FL=1